MEYFVVMSYVCPRVTFLPGSKMTLFTFYNYFDVPLIFEFVIAISHVYPKVRFLPESKMAHFTNILTFILSLFAIPFSGCEVSRRTQLS